MNGAGVQGLLTVVAPVAARVLVTVLWQGLLLTAVVALVLRSLPGLSAVMRTRVWVITAALILLLPVLPQLGPVHGGHLAAGEMHVGGAWSLGLLVFWVCLSAWQAARMAWGMARIRGLVRRARAVEASDRSLPVMVSDEVGRPSLAGVVRPCVLLPAGLLETLSPMELEHVLLHEREHLRRGDPWLNVFQQCAVLLLPFQPAMYWLDRHLSRERELACDEGVLRALPQRQAYAASLVKLAEDSMLRRGVHLALGLLGARGRRSELVVRVQRILVEPVRIPLWKRRSALAGLCALMLTAIVAFAWAPQLVSFDEASPVMVAGTREQAAPLAPASGMMGLEHTASGNVHPVLTRAALPASTVAKPRTTSLVYRVHPAPLRRARFTRHERERGPVAAPFSLRRVEAVKGIPPVGPRMVRVLMSEPEPYLAQPVYAAVPWRNGWLILQL